MLYRKKDETNHRLCVLRKKLGENLARGLSEKDIVG